jgi:uncharacterized Zn finger protein
MSYNPGQATTPRQLGGDLYAIDSFRGEGKSYTVNAQTGTCDCPHFQTRLAGIENAECKHIVAVRDFIAALDPAAEKRDRLAARTNTQLRSETSLKRLASVKAR